MPNNKVLRALDWIKNGLYFETLQYHSLHGMVCALKFFKFAVRHDSVN
jgi:hypothetical protein